MKYKGKRPTQNIEVVCLPRMDGDIIFQCQSVVSFEDFDKACSEPQPPMKVKASGESEPLLTDTAYVLRMADYRAKRYCWLILQSMRATPDLEWERVNYDEPDTWQEWSKELTEAHFSTVEINLIVTAVMTANSLNEDRLEEAKSRFLASQLAAQNQ